MPCVDIIAHTAIHVCIYVGMYGGASNCYGHIIITQYYVWSRDRSPDFNELSCCNQSNCSIFYSIKALTSSLWTELWIRDIDYVVVTASESVQTRMKLICATILSFLAVTNAVQFIDCGKLWYYIVMCVYPLVVSICNSLCSQTVGKSHYKLGRSREKPKCARYILCSKQASLILQVTCFQMTCELACET